MKLILLNKKELLLCGGLIGLLFIAVFIFAFINHNLDRSFFLGLLFNDAKEFVETGKITSKFMPIGYTGFLSACMKIGGVEAIPACQSFVYLGILLISYWFFKTRKIGSIFLLLGILAVAFHPILFLNTWRIHDGNLTVLLLLGFLTAGISYMREKKFWKIIVLGIFAGLLFVVRQNTAPLFVIILFFLWIGSKQKQNF